MTWRGSSEEVMTKVPMARQTITLADILQNLKSYDEEPFDCQDPTIYAAEPWTAHSQAIVSWSMPKGGLPEDAAKLRLMCLIEVRKAIGILRPGCIDFPEFGNRLIAAALLHQLSRDRAEPCRADALDH